MGDEPHSVFLPPILRLIPDLSFHFTCGLSKYNTELEDELKKPTARPEASPCAERLS